jgi:transcriptional regulator with XRE-family HTH domain
MSTESPVPPDSAVPSFVRAARTSMSLSQDEFGALFDRSQVTVSTWERGAFVPDYDTMVAISVRSGLPLPGVPIGLMPGGGTVFGDAHLQLLAKSMAEAKRRLPRVMVSALVASPPKTLAELSEFVKMLDDVLGRYPDAG